MSVRVMRKTETHRREGKGDSGRVKVGLTYIYRGAMCNFWLAIHQPQKDTERLRVGSHEGKEEEQVFIPHFYLS